MAQRVWFRRIGILAALVLALGVAGSFWLWSKFGPLLKLRPTQPFSLDGAPPAPDYAEEASWAALPTRKEEADLLPASGGFEDRQASAPADVFFIHPTTFVQPQWNAPIDPNSRTQEGTEMFLAGEATPFNGCCRVFAPHYRQATFYAFVDEGKDGSQALSLAYDDVRRAFRHFIKHRNQGRPFIVASHSQGTLHGYRLLRDEIAGTPLQDRLVAAYLLGYPLPPEDLGANYDSLSLCEQPTSTGCLVAYETWVRGTFQQYPHYLWRGDGLERKRTTASICVNPISWQNHKQTAPAEDHLGAVRAPDLPTSDHLLLGTEHTGRRIEALFAPEPRLTSARCNGRVLEVDQLPYPPWRRFFLDGNYHLHDFTLFHLDIRKNAQVRVDAWLAGQNQEDDVSGSQEEKGSTGT